MSFYYNSTNYQIIMEPKQKQKITNLGKTKIFQNKLNYENKRKVNVYMYNQKVGTKCTFTYHWRNSHIYEANFF